MVMKLFRCPKRKRMVNQSHTLRKLLKGSHLSTVLLLLIAIKTNVFPLLHNATVYFTIILFV